MIENGARVEQRLGGMLMGAIARVDDGNLHVAREKMRRARGRMAHHDGVGPHRHQRVQRVYQRFALRDAGTRRRDGQRIRAEALGGDLEAHAGARGGFEEQVHDGLAAQHFEAAVAFVGKGLKKSGSFENGFNLGAVEALDIEKAGGLDCRFFILQTACVSARSQSSTFSILSISWNFTSMISLSEV